MPGITISQKCFLEVTCAKVRFGIYLTDETKVHSPRPGNWKTANLKWNHDKLPVNIIRLITASEIGFKQGSIWRDPLAFVTKWNTGLKVGNGSRAPKGKRTRKQEAVLLSPVEPLCPQLISGWRVKSHVDFVKGQAGFPVGVEMTQA